MEKVRESCKRCKPCTWDYGECKADPVQAKEEYNKFKTRWILQVQHR
jgi:hypothetical protein